MDQLLCTVNRVALTGGYIWADLEMGSDGTDIVRCRAKVQPECFGNNVHWSRNLQVPKSLCDQQCLNMVSV